MIIKETVIIEVYPQHHPEISYETAEEWNEKLMKYLVGKVRLALSDARLENTFRLMPRFAFKVITVDLTDLGLVECHRKLNTIKNLTSDHMDVYNAYERIKEVVRE